MGINNSLVEIEKILKSGKVINQNDIKRALSSLNHNGINMNNNHQVNNIISKLTVSQINSINRKLATISNLTFDQIHKKMFSGGTGGNLYHWLIWYFIIMWIFASTLD